MMKHSYEIIPFEQKQVPFCSFYADVMEEFSRDLYGNYFVLGCIAYTMGNIGAHIANATVFLA